MKSKWIAACDYLVFWPIIYKGRKRGCLFGFDTINQKIGLVDIVPESEFVLFLQEYGCINECNNYFPDECNVILKIDESVLMILHRNSESYQITVTEEEYDRLEQYISTILPPDYFGRVNEERAESS